jgi:3alpha(or 20beta)-hydroxysteroid dehydrogenase
MTNAMPSGRGLLEGKVALITGAARGQGAAEAVLFAAEGARVVLFDILDDLGEAVAARLGGDIARYVHLDVSGEEDWAAGVAAAMAAFGGIDILINNAGIPGQSTLVDTTLETWQRVVDVNQRGVFLGMRAVVPAMTERGAGSIVNTSSVVGTRGVAGMFPYNATKWAIRGMTKTAALELAPLRIRVNLLLPGLIDTPILGDVPPEVAEMIAATIPLEQQGRPRIGQAEDVAAAALYLCSPAAIFVSGAELAVDGAHNAG